MKTAGINDVKIKIDKNSDKRHKTVNSNNKVKKT